MHHDDQFNTSIDNTDKFNTSMHTRMQHNDQFNNMHTSMYHKYQFNTGMHTCMQRNDQFNKSMYTSMQLKLELVFIAISWFVIILLTALLLYCFINFRLTVNFFLYNLLPPRLDTVDQICINDAPWCVKAVHSNRRHILIYSLVIRAFNLVCNISVLKLVSMVKSLNHPPIFAQ